MRPIATDLSLCDLQNRVVPLVDELFARIPAGVGGRSQPLLSREEFRALIERGIDWCFDAGYASEDDLIRIE